MLTGLVDLHVHTSPDVRPRQFSDLELAQLAQRKGAAGIVLKGHAFSTVLRAREAQAAVAGVRVMGGIVLNVSSGGLDPSVVSRACAEGARIVWMPTLDAAHHRRHEGKSGGLEIASGRALRPEVKEILALIARHDLALATGHLSPIEIKRILTAAFSAGVRRLIVNHPEHRVTGLSLVEQRELLREVPVFFERCYAQPGGNGRYVSNLATNLTAIETLGPDSTVLASDSGQMESEPWDRAWEEIATHAANQGLSETAFHRMTQINPRFLCGLTKTIQTETTPSPHAA